MLILGIDPGIARLGYGLIKFFNNQFQTLTYGCLETFKTDPLPQRLAFLYQEVEKILNNYHPDILGIEDLFFNKNVKTAITVAHARGVILLAGSLQKIEIREYTPLQIKQAIVGNGRAIKKQVQYMVKVLLNLTEIPQPDDTADALAVAICTAFSWKLTGIKR